jgi:hypothetical protein
MKRSDEVMSDLCEEIDQLRTERDQWKGKYEDCDRMLQEFVDSSIKNGEATHNNWVLLYALKFPPQKKYTMVWENPKGFPFKMGIWDTREECQKVCEEQDLKWPTIRHWPEEIR